MNFLANIIPRPKRHVAIQGFAAQVAAATFLDLKVVKEAILWPWNRPATAAVEMQDRIEHFQLKILNFFYIFNALFKFQTLLISFYDICQIIVQKRQINVQNKTDDDFYKTYKRDGWDSSWTMK